MARIAGVNLPTNKRVIIALTYIHGIGRKTAVDIATNRRFALIEALAEAIAGTCLARFPRIETIAVRIDKPSAPIPAVLDYAAIEIVRGRSDRAATTETR